MRAGHGEAQRDSWEKDSQGSCGTWMKLGKQKIHGGVAPTEGKEQRRTGPGETPDHGEIQPSLCQPTGAGKGSRATGSVLGSACSQSPVLGEWLGPHTCATQRYWLTAERRVTLLESWADLQELASGPRANPSPGAQSFLLGSLSGASSCRLQ